MMEIFRFKHLERWDKFTIPRLHFPANVPSEKIGSLLMPRDERVDRASWSFEDLQPITIHFGGGISRRRVKKGRAYKLPLLWVRPGDVVLSKIDLKNGAVGVLPCHFENAVVTTHFKVYEPDLTRLHPPYFHLLLQTSEFKRWLWANRSGADGRTEVKLPVFEDLKIPLPPITEQRSLVATHDITQDRAARLEREADEIEAQAAESFETAVGFNSPTQLPDQPVFVASFKNLDRWGHEPALRRMAGGASATPRWPIVPVSEIVDDLIVGWSPKCLNRPARDKEWGVLKLSAVTSGYLKSSENKALPPDLEPRPKLEVKRGDVLITRGSGVTRLVGVTAFVADKPPRKLMICDLIFRVVFKEAHEIEPAYLAAVLGTKELRNQIEELRTGAAPMMQKITKSALMSLKLPLPLKDEQIRLVDALTAARATAVDIRMQARKARAQARTDFEAAVYAAEETTDAAEFLATKS